MRPMEMMDALGGVPRDLISECFLDPAENKDAKQGTEPAAAVRRAAKPEHTRIRVPRLITAAALSACMLFAAGVGVFLIHGSREHEVLQSTADSVPADETEAVQTEPAETVPSPAAETEPPAVYAELELHGNEKHIYTWEESDALLNEARERYRQNGGPLLIDTEQYIATYFAPDSAADLNDLEAKSFLYHMMLNSIDYFTSAEGEMIYGTPDEETVICFQTDGAAKKSYEHEQSGDREYETYYSGSDDAFSSFLTNVDLNEKTYTQSFCSVNSQNDFIMSDNDRRSYQPDGTGLAFNRMDDINLGIPSSCCLFPQSFAMSRLDDFDLWKITGTESFLSRNCAVIEGKHGGSTMELLVDVRTGILMKYEERGADGILHDCHWVTALRIDEPFSVREFDPTGLTDTDPMQSRPEN